MGFAFGTTNTKSLNFTEMPLSKVLYFHFKIAYWKRMTKPCFCKVQHLSATAENGYGHLEKKNKA